MAGIIVRPRSRIFHGHDWVYATEILKVFGEPQDGDVISIKDGRDRMLGSAIYNSNSQIVARRFSHRRQLLDQDFFERRIAQAIEVRDKCGVTRKIRRLVWSEADGLPGLILDQYENVVVLQTTTLGMDLAIDRIVAAIEKVLAPCAIIERNDASGRATEGLAQRAGLLRGEIPENMVVAMDGVKFEIDLMRGHKTGLYLDQADNYRAVAEIAQGRRVLDCFSNQGAFALFCARAGAEEVTAVESSAEAVEVAKRNSAINELSIQWREANVFDDLVQREKAGETFDLIILDPPSFTRTRERVNEALRGYKEIHLRAIKLLAKGGMLATYCCSHHVDWKAFEEIISAAAVDARRSLRRVGIHTQSPDHPVVLGIPETEYLKGYLFELVPSR